MKVKAKISTQVLPLPNSPIPDRYIVQVQWTDGGAVVTKDNDGAGYTLTDAQAIANKYKPVAQ